MYCVLCPMHLSLIYLLVILFTLTETLHQSCYQRPYSDQWSATVVIIFKCTSAAARYSEDSLLSFQLLASLEQSPEDCHIICSMFQRIDNVAIQGSPSFQSNNLSSLGGFLCYVHLNDVSIQDEKRFMKIVSPRFQIYEVLTLTM